MSARVSFFRTQVHSGGSWSFPPRTLGIRALRAWLPAVLVIVAYGLIGMPFTDPAMEAAALHPSLDARGVRTAMVRVQIAAGDSGAAATAGVRSRVVQFADPSVRAVAGFLDRASGARLLNWDHVPFSLRRDDAHLQQRTIIVRQGSFNDVQTLAAMPRSSRFDEHMGADAQIGGPGHPLHLRSPIPVADQPALENPVHASVWIRTAAA